MKILKSVANIAIEEDEKREGEVGAPGRVASIQHADGHHCPAAAPPHC